jgi:hypothetical protein
LFVVHLFSENITKDRESIQSLASSEPTSLSRYLAQPFNPVASIG